MKTLRIALAQTNPIVGDLTGNTKKILAFARKAASQGTELVIFPELSVCGYPPEDLLCRPYFVKENIKCLQQIKKSLPNITAVIGFVDSKNNKLYNSAAVINNNRLSYIYHKIHLPNYGVFDEKRYFTPSNEYGIFKEKGLKWSASICEDIWIEPYLTAHQTRFGGAQLITNLSASPYHKGKWKERKRLLQKQARQYRTTIAYCNLVGGQDELVFDGHSFIIDQSGKIVAQAKQFEEDIIYADLNFPSEKQTRKPTKKDLKIKQVNLKITPAKKKPVLPKMKNPLLSPDGEIYEALTLGLRDYVQKNRFQQVILGLSGGIDSSLTALIAVDAIGKDNVLGLSMPSEYTSKASLDDAAILAKNLGIQLRTVPITNIFKIYLQDLKKHFRNSSWDATEENLQARISGNLLMAFSNKFGYLVLTTGNKSETSVGYCTLYGDMAGGFAVIKDVPKELVYRLTQYRNQTAKRMLVPENVLTKAPTAELRKGQKDEDSLPPYPVLDPIIDAYVEKQQSLQQIIRSGVSKKTAKRVIQLINFNEYKRRQAPPGVKITPKAFGKDRRMPITNHASY